MYSSSERSKVILQTPGFSVFHSSSHLFCISSPLLTSTFFLNPDILQKLFWWYPVMTMRQGTKQTDLTFTYLRDSLSEYMCRNITHVSTDKHIQVEQSLWPACWSINKAEEKIWKLSKMKKTWQVIQAIIKHNLKKNTYLLMLQPLKLFLKDTLQLKPLPGFRSRRGKDLNFLQNLFVNKNHQMKRRKNSNWVKRIHVKTYWYTM